MRNTVITVVFLMLMTIQIVAAADFQGVNISTKKVEKHGGLTVVPEYFLMDKVDSKTISSDVQAKVARIQEIVNSGKITKECLELETQIQDQRYEVRVNRNMGRNEVYISGRLPNSNDSPFVMPLSASYQVFTANSHPDFPDKQLWVKLKTTELNFDEIKKRKAVINSDSVDVLNAPMYDSLQKCYWLNSSAYVEGMYSAVFTVVSMGGTKTVLLIIIDFNSKYEVTDQYAFSIGIFKPSRKLSPAEQAFLPYCWGMTPTDGSDSFPKQPKVQEEVKKVLEPNPEVKPQPLDKRPAKIDYFTTYTEKVAEGQKAMFSHGTSGNVDKVMLDGIPVNICDKAYEWPIKYTGLHTLVAYGPDGYDMKQVFVEVVPKPVEKPVPVVTPTVTPSPSPTTTPSPAPVAIPSPCATPEATREPVKPKKAKPVIKKFKVNVYEVTAGQAICVEWESEGTDPDGFSIDGEVMKDISGAKPFYPDKSRTYRGVASNEAGETIKTFNVKVIPAPTPPPPTPVAEKPPEPSKEVSQPKLCGYGIVEIYFKDIYGNSAETYGFTIITSAGESEIGPQKYGVRLRKVPEGKVRLKFRGEKWGPDQTYWLESNGVLKINLVKGGE